MSEAELLNWQARQYPILKTHIAELEAENTRLDTLVHGQNSAMALLERERIIQYLTEREWIIHPSASLGDRRRIEERWRKALDPDALGNLFKN